MIRDLYQELAAALTVVDRDQAVDELRQAINADPSLAMAMRDAAARSAICGLGLPDLMIPE